MSNYQFNYDGVVKRVNSYFELSIRIRLIFNSQVRASFNAHFPDAPFLERREDPTDEGMVEPNDPGINGFTPDPQPEHQAARSTAVSTTLATTVEEQEANIENSPLQI